MRIYLSCCGIAPLGKCSIPELIIRMRTAPYRPTPVKHSQSFQNFVTLKSKRPPQERQVVASRGQVAPAGEQVGNAIQSKRSNTIYTQCWGENVLRLPGA